MDDSFKEDPDARKQCIQSELLFSGYCNTVATFYFRLSDVKSVSYVYLYQYNSLDTEQLPLMYLNDDNDQQEWIGISLDFACVEKKVKLLEWLGKEGKGTLGYRGGLFVVAYVAAQPICTL